MKVTIIAIGSEVNCRDLVLQGIDVQTMEEFRNILKVFTVKNVQSNCNFGITIQVYNTLKNWPIEGRVISMLDGKIFNIKK